MCAQIAASAFQVMSGAPQEIGLFLIDGIANGRDLANGILLEKLDNVAQQFHITFDAIEQGIGALNKTQNHYAALRKAEGAEAEKAERERDAAAKKPGRKVA